MTATTDYRPAQQTVKDLAAELGVKASTVYRWIADGSLHARYRVVAVKTGRTWTITLPEDVKYFEAPKPAVNLEARIRAAYATLRTARHEWVGFAELRPMLADVARADLDYALRQMLRCDDVVIIPENNQKALRQEDRKAALWLGDQPKHYIACGIR
ncbi:helix-turn-helix domain-containing protein [Nonomuraea sp. NPDC059194]|uniref:helix-turn-helix domain-containing protein n=1 Tax=Nonomuraea sp. NPDC059194 TaxID=3346764 RepID=UPI0036B0B5B8